MSLGQGLGIRGSTGKQDIHEQRSAGSQDENGYMAHLSLGAFLTQQHVGDPAAVGEQMPRFWALQGAP